MASNENGKNGLRAPATIAVHGGRRADERPYGAVVSPVSHSTIYGFESFSEMRRYVRGESSEGYFYSRYSNPTVAEVERKIAELEGAEGAVVTASGSAAAFAALAAECQAGDEIIACETIYGGTIKIMTEVMGRFGIGARFISIDDIPRLPELRGERTRAFWFETPTNPTNRLVDIEQAARAARAARLFSITDNTFATPVLQRPLELGVDAVVHSATKYFGGHSDLTAGAVVGRADFIERVRRLAILVGATLDPAAAYLLARGLKTLDIRVRVSCDNALRVARSLSEHKNIARVYYSGLEEDPDHKLARRQMSAFGGVLAVDLVGGEAEVERLFDRLQLVRSAPSLGGVETLASYPLYSSHYGFTEAQLRAAGVSPATVRFAIGIEAADDIIADITQALDRI
ncbi:MAG TPA: aminotransferase class I/II-fold pyridoxal phosphate-dependent enzyme [Pyrinomonadaceae bacterium]|jgi:cystathionine beta-lyase/cystathionine gamma-synthase|nr:aminotransferase class I/II-fold pyridoxal phosphate-dependent enzyme [Pyrinomonadaceae bacterium]